MRRIRYKLQLKDYNMKFKQYMNELKIQTRQTSGTMYGVVNDLDSYFQDKKLKKKVQLKAGDRWYDFDKGSLVSNLKGGLFIKMANRKDEPDGSDKKWGIMVTTSKDNLEKLVKAL